MARSFATRSIHFSTTFTEVALPFIVQGFGNPGLCTSSQSFAASLEQNAAYMLANYGLDLLPDCAAKETFLSLLLDDSKSFNYQTYMDAASEPLRVLEILGYTGSLTCPTLSNYTFTYVGGYVPSTPPTITGSYDMGWGRAPGELTYGLRATMSIDENANHNESISVIGAPFTVAPGEIIYPINVPKAISPLVSNYIFNADFSADLIYNFDVPELMREMWPLCTPIPPIKRPKVPFTFQPDPDPDAPQYPGNILIDRQRTFLSNYTSTLQPFKLSRK